MNVAKITKVSQNVLYKRLVIQHKHPETGGSMFVVNHQRTVQFGGPGWFLL